MPQHMINDPLALGAQHQLGNYKATYEPTIMTQIIGRILRNRMQRVFVYDHGLISVQRTTLQCIRWQDVQTIRRKAEWSDSDSPTTYYSYIVACTDGTQLTLDPAIAHQLGWSIEEETASYLFPEVLKTYQEGQSVTFGPLTVTSQGLCYKTELLHWTEMKSLTINGPSNFIRITKQGRLLAWASLPLEKVPNLEVFRRLIQHITGATPSRFKSGAALYARYKFRS